MNRRRFFCKGKVIKLENVVTPLWMRIGMPWVTWRRKSSSSKRVYLTFDDGPSAELTDWLLDALKQYDAKATFFCLGENVENNPDQFSAMIKGGHLIGNHSHTHLNGWKTGTKPYLEDVQRCQDVLRESLGYEPKLFRPPFGRVSITQLFQLRRKFEVVMWDILSMDYRPELDGERIARNVIESANSGSIVLLHDSELVADRVREALPQILKHFSEKGFEMCTLDQ